MAEEEIIVQEINHARVVILNRPKQLNALSHWMVGRLKELYEQWEVDDNVFLIIIKGSGRAFCAGGDVAATYHYVNAGNYNLSKDFFYKEYKLNYLVGTYKKPHVALLDGITMGGGTGISIHGALRVATEKTVFSMPETGLGLHPDVGASYFLSRLPGYLGEYVGLTGTRLDGGDMLAVGLATHFVPSKVLPELEKALQSLISRDIEAVSEMIDEYCESARPKERSPLHRLPKINKCFSAVTVEQILKALDNEKYNGDDWCKETMQRLKKASPLSLKVTLRSIRDGRHQSLRECLIREYRLSARCVEAKLSNDFHEGVRALLVDKDHKPKWNPASLELVTGDLVEHYFLPLVESVELELPPRFGGVKKTNFVSRL